MTDIEPRKKILFYDLMKNALDQGFPAILLTLENGDMVADIFPTDKQDIVDAIKVIANESPACQEEVL